jgi:trehalose/maltose transport system substrate-binding protein
MKRVLSTLTLALGLFAFAQKDVTVTWIVGNRPQDTEYGLKVGQQYSASNPHTIGGEQYNVTVNVVAGPESATDRAQQYLQYFEAKSAEVDLFQIDVIWPGDMAENLADLYQYEGFKEAAADYFPAIVENNTVGGKLVGIPWFTDAGLLYYRQDLLDEYGLTAPATWADLEAAAAKIQEGERAKGNADFWGFVWQGNASNGGTIVSADKVITINNENAIAALEMAKGWVGTISPDGVIGFQEEDARNIWQAGNAAFMRNWPYAYGLGNGEGSAVAGKFAVSALPSVDGGKSAATLGGWQLAVSKYSANPAVAADFALFATNEETQLQTALEMSLLPTRPAVYSRSELTSSPNAFMSEFLPVFQAAVARPSTATAPNYLQTSQLFFTAVNAVLKGDMDAADAVANLELDLADLTGYEIGAPQ